MAIETPRSGDTVLQTAERFAPVMGLLAPFLDGGVAWLNDHLHYTVLGDNYATALQAALLTYLPILLGRWHMRRIRQADALAALEARNAPWPPAVRPPTSGGAADRFLGDLSGPKGFPDGPA